MRRLLLTTISMLVITVTKAQTDREMAMYVFEGLNKFRVANGVQPLVFNEKEYINNSAKLTPAKIEKITPENNKGAWIHPSLGGRGENMGMITVTNMKEDIFKKLDALYFELEDYPKLNKINIVKTWATSTGHRQLALDETIKSCTVVVRKIPRVNTFTYSGSTYNIDYFYLLVVLNVY